MKRIVRERRHRLARELYRGKLIASFTLCTLHRTPLFEGPPLVTELATLLKEASFAQECEILVYLFMPDICMFFFKAKVRIPIATSPSSISNNDPDISFIGIAVAGSGKRTSTIMSSAARKKWQSMSGTSCTTLSEQE